MSIHSSINNKEMLQHYFLELLIEEENNVQTVGNELERVQKHYNDIKQKVDELRKVIDILKLKQD